MPIQEQTPLAILGAGCYVPGANSVDEYWALLVNGRYPITEIPESLLPRDLYFSPEKAVHGKTYFDRAGFVDRLPYDPKLYPLPARFDEFLDTIPLMMCRAAADACRDARMDPFRITNPGAGVYVGCNSTGLWSDDQQYGLMAGTAGEILSQLPALQELAGTDSAAIASETVDNVRRGLSTAQSPPSRMTTSPVNVNAISEAFGLDGPSVLLDATCSTSLKALAVAKNDLEQGVVDMAFVGGAYKHSLDAILQFGMNGVATADVSRPFSDDADGVVISEGYLMIVVKTLDRALADGDPIRAVVRGIGVSSDGKGRGVWAPRKEGQMEAIRRAYDDKSDMSRLDFYEGHVTSTTLGDLTEMETLTEVFSGNLPVKIPLGSVKANIGHTLEAAGLAGLVKSMLVLEHGLVPRQIHCETLNTRVDWDKLPFYVPRQNTPLAKRQDGKPRRAGVNAFGIGGLNTHAILEDPVGVLDEKSRVVASVPAMNLAPHNSSVTSRNPQHDEPIAVIGYGSVLPGARAPAAFEDLVFSSTDVVGRAPDDRWCREDWFGSGATAVGGQHTSAEPTSGSVVDFEYDWRRHRISPKHISLADPLMFMMLSAVDAAWDCAGLQEKDVDRARTEVIVGTNFESDFFLGFAMGGRIPQFVREMKNTCRRRGFVDEARLQEAADAFEKEFLRQHPGLMDELATCIPSTFASRIGKVYDVMGGAVAVESGDTSGLAAIAQAVGSLRANGNSLVICVAGSRSIAQQLEAIRCNRAISPTYQAVPPAEGATALLLKRLSDAERDGDPIHAVIHSVGAAFSADAETAFRTAINNAWEGVDQTQGSLTPAAVRSVELSPAPDDVRAAEVRALADFYGVYCDHNALVVGALDSQIGDTMAASGMAATIKASIQLEKQCAPRLVDNRRGLNNTSNWGGPLLAPRESTTLHATSPDQPLLAAVTSYDSFGSAYHLVLERGRRTEMQSATPKAYHSLISTFHGVNGTGESCAEVVYDPTKDRMLVDHRLRDRPLLPGALTIESFSQAAMVTTPGEHVLAVHDVKFIDGLRFIDDTSKAAKVYARPDGQRVHCRLAVDFRNRRGDLVKADRIYTTGSVELCAEPPRLDIPRPTGCPLAGWYDLVYLEPGTMLYHGPAFHELRRLVFGESDIWGECTIAADKDSGAERGRWLTWPATLDACLYLGGFAFWKWNDRIIGLPKSIDMIRYGRPPREGEECLARAWLVRTLENGMTFDFALFGEDGEALLHGEGYEMQLVPGSKKLAADMPVLK